MALLITNKTAKHIPRKLLLRVFHLASKKHTMEVSLVFLGDRAARHLNKKWRKKNKPANVLAFPLDATVGEIIINPYEAEREAHAGKTSYTHRVAYLFLHGLLHLYGYNHETDSGAKKMEQKERKLMQNVNTLNYEI